MPHRKSKLNASAAESTRREMTRYAAEAATGLTSEQAEEYRRNGWDNRAVDPPSKSRRDIILSNVVTYFNLIFLIIAGLLIFVGSYRDLTFLPIIIANSLIGIIQELRAKKTLDELTVLHAPKARVIRDGKEKTIPAEQLVLEDISTGASNDIERATNIARNMVTRYGMSDAIGPVNYSSEEEVFLGRDFSTKKNISEAVTSEIDHEIRRIIEDAYTRTVELLEANMDKLHAVAKGLMELETIDAEQFERLFNGEPLEVLKAEFDEKQEEKLKKQEEVRRQARERAAREQQLKILSRNYEDPKPVDPVTRQRDEDWQELREFDNMRSGISGREPGNPVNKPKEGPGEESPKTGSDQEDL